MLLLIEFIVFAFLGWIVDSTYSSLISRKIIISGYFKGAPFCAIYGFGGIIILNSFISLSSVPFFVTIGLTTFFVILLEYIGGWFVDHVLEEKLWDYSTEKYNLHGYISAWHSFLWLLGVTFLYLLVDKKLSSFTLQTNPYSDLIDICLFASLIIFVTILNKHHRLTRLAQKSLNEMKKMI